MTTPTGRFVWFDHVSTEQPKAQAFYGELFGWSQKSMPTPDGGTYAMFALGDDSLGGYMTTPEGAPSQAHWLSHLQVTDARGAADKITSLGGKVLKGPTEVGMGVWAIVQDPLGGTFGLWQPKTFHGNGEFKGKHGAWVWNELLTQDADKSIAFYTKLAGWTDQPMDMGQMTYHVMNFEEKGRAGIMKAPMPQMPQMWMPYVQVDNADQIVERAKKLGGSVMMGPDDVPNVGRIAVLVDPLGAAIGILQPAPGM